MQTSSFTYFRTRPGGIRISVGLPRFIKGAHDMPYVRELMPHYFVRLPGGGNASLKLTTAQKQASFRNQLKDLDAQEIYDHCVQLVAPHTPVLLCFENPPFGNGHWCHRRAVAEWMESEIGISVPELGTLF